MPYKVLFAGLMCFHTHRNDANDVMALLPDGRTGTSEPHAASIVIRTHDVISDNWPHQSSHGDVTVFRIEDQMELQLPSMDTSVDMLNHKVPGLKSVDPDFDIDRTKPAIAIARLQIRGSAASFIMPKAKAIYSEVVTVWDREIDIIGNQMSIKVAPRTEIGILNVSVGDAGDEKAHFRIYEKLAKNGANLSSGPKPVGPVPKSNSIHPIFDDLTKKKVSLYCSNTGCC